MNNDPQLIQPVAANANNTKIVNTETGYTRTGEKEKQPDSNVSKTELPCIYHRPIFRLPKYDVLL